MDPVQVLREAICDLIAVDYDPEVIEDDHTIESAGNVVFELIHTSPPSFLNQLALEAVNYQYDGLALTTLKEAVEDQLRHKHGWSDSEIRKASILVGLDGEDLLSALAHAVLDEVALS
jgi:hypothetical protein